MRACPYCGQGLPEVRLGVRLTALKARIFDLVQRGGQNGITSDDLFEIALEGKTRETMKAHIYQINELIQDEGYWIKGGSGPGCVYRLVKV